jgi:hypothetical protein
LWQQVSALAILVEECPLGLPCTAQCLIFTKLALLAFCFSNCKNNL